MNKLTLIVLILFLFFNTSNTEARVLAGESQYSARLYTEVLGRIPDDAAWNAHMDYWNTEECTVENLKWLGLTFFNSQEFASLGLTNREKVLVLYRSILLREPDQGGYNAYLNHLNIGVTHSTLAAIFYESSEFKSRQTHMICKDVGYGWVNSTPINMSVLENSTPDIFAGGTGAQLQDMINSASWGQTIYLAKGSVTTVTTPLNIPDGVTLQTKGAPTTNRYSKMGRIVRGSFFAGELIKVGQHAHVKNIWIDGGRSRFGFATTKVSVRALGGAGGSSFIYNKLSNTAGATSIVILGSVDNFPCSSRVVNWNMITLYSSTHTDFEWADGITTSCEGTTISGNYIVDATDVGIVVFRSGVVAQASQVNNNQILNAGNSAYGSIVIEPFSKSASNTDFVYSFVGTDIRDNYIGGSLSPDVHVDIVLSVGTKIWNPNNANGEGAFVRNNRSRWSPIFANIGIAVNGMWETTVQNNTLATIRAVTGTNCTEGEVVVDRSFASGNIQTYIPGSLSGCINGGSAHE